MTHRGDDIIAESTALRAVLDRALRFAAVDATVLVTGESGVGKERVARYVHGHSRRARGPFIAVNTGAIPESLLESELFGYLKGAFTGADRDTPGLFTAADKGTLFLDEVGEMSPAMQSRLLRVLQEREVRPVGARTPRPIDVRVLAATNADLTGLVARRAFREDLYYRLDVVSLHVPPLRERPDDLVPLATLFLARATGRRPGTPSTQLSRGAITALRAYDWPGNVRELENAMEHAAALTDGREIVRDVLPDAVLGRARSPRRTPPGVAIGTALTLDEVQRRHVAAVLAVTEGNRTRAAEILGVAPSTLWRWTQRAAKKPRRS